MQGDSELQVNRAGVVRNDKINFFFIKETSDFALLFNYKALRMRTQGASDEQPAIHRPLEEANGSEVLASSNKLRLKATVKKLNEY